VWGFLCIELDELCCYTGRAEYLLKLLSDYSTMSLLLRTAKACSPTECAASWWPVWKSS